MGVANSNTNLGLAPLNLARGRKPLTIGKTIKALWVSPPKPREGTETFVGLTRERGPLG